MNKTAHGLALIRRAFSFLLLMVLLKPSFANSVDCPGSAGPSDRLKLRITASCRVCMSGKELYFGSDLESLCGPRIGIRSAFFTITDESGEEVLVEPDGLLPEDKHVIEAGERSYSGYMRSSLSEALENLPTGVYQATWLVNGVASNVVTFEIDRRASVSELQPLMIEPVVYADSRTLPSEFVAFFRNTEEASISLINSWKESSIFVDGAEYRLNGVFWAGNSDVSAGRAWSSYVRLSDFVSKDLQPIGAGKHKVQYRFAGHLSNVITLEVFDH